MSELFRSLFPEQFNENDPFHTDIFRMLENEINFSILRFRNKRDEEIALHIPDPVDRLAEIDEIDRIEMEETHRLLRQRARRFHRQGRGDESTSSGQTTSSGEDRETSHSDSSIIIEVESSSDDSY